TTSASRRPAQGRSWTSTPTARPAQSTAPPWADRSCRPTCSPSPPTFRASCPPPRSNDPSVMDRVGVWVCGWDSDLHPHAHTPTHPYGPRMTTPATCSGIAGLERRLETGEGGVPVGLDLVEPAARLVEAGGVDLPDVVAADAGAVRQAGIGED